MTRHNFHDCTFAFAGHVDTDLHGQLADSLTHAEMTVDDRPPVASGVDEYDVEALLREVGCVRARASTNVCNPRASRQEPVEDVPGAKPDEVATAPSPQASALVVELVEAQEELPVTHNHDVWIKRLNWW